MAASYKHHVMDEMNREKEEADRKRMARYSKEYELMRQKQERNEAKKSADIGRSRVSQRTLRELFSAMCIWKP